MIMKIVNDKYKQWNIQQYSVGFKYLSYHSFGKELLTRCIMFYLIIDVGKGFP